MHHPVYKLKVCIEAGDSITAIFLLFGCMRMWPIDAETLSHATLVTEEILTDNMWPSDTNLWHFCC